MIKLPQLFTERMRRQLGEEYELFEACYTQEEYAGLRINTMKISSEIFSGQAPFSLEKVPWTENGFYYNKDDAVTRHPYYFAGLYYIQEPSAMLPASRLPVEPGHIVLDLCAAPGGKATELSSRLKGEGLLIANDVSPSRAKALYKNLAVWGSPNCCITGETPQKLLDAFGCVFDRILVDAPCSGEGMFRKDPSLIASWEEHGPKYYADLQKEILSCAVSMLRPDGMILYSTCTFAPEEDEEVIAYILDKYPELELLQPDMKEGFVSGNIPYEKCIRIWPHKIKGEGHFLALLHKKGDADHTCGFARYSRTDIEKSQKKIPDEVKDFLKLLPDHFWKEKYFEMIGEQCYLMPEYKLPKKLRYLRTGIQLGTYKKGRFEPSQQLAMLLSAETYPYILNLSSADQRVIRYLKGETLELSNEEDTYQKGWILICTDGYALGWGKYAAGSVRNKYYPGWRLQ